MEFTIRRYFLKFEKFTPDERYPDVDVKMRASFLHVILEAH
jgi:hypothetical protein